MASSSPGRKFLVLLLVVAFSIGVMVQALPVTRSQARSVHDPKVQHRGSPRGWLAALEAQKREQQQQQRGDEVCVGPSKTLLCEDNSSPQSRLRETTLPHAAPLFDRGKPLVQPEAPSFGAGPEAKGDVGPLSALGGLKNGILMPLLVSALLGFGVGYWLGQSTSHTLIQQTAKGGAERSRAQLAAEVRMAHNGPAGSHHGWAGQGTATCSAAAGDGTGEGKQEEMEREEEEVGAKFSRPALAEEAMRDLRTRGRVAKTLIDNSTLTQRKPDIDLEGRAIPRLAEHQPEVVRSSLPTAAASGQDLKLHRDGQRVEGSQEFSGQTPGAGAAVWVQGQELMAAGSPLVEGDVRAEPKNGHTLVAERCSPGENSLLNTVGGVHSQIHLGPGMSERASAACSPRWDTQGAQTGTPSPLRFRGQALKLEDASSSMMAQAMGRGSAGLPRTPDDRTRGKSPESALSPEAQDASATGVAADWTPPTQSAWSGARDYSKSNTPLQALDARARRGGSEAPTSLARVPHLPEAHALILDLVEVLGLDPGNMSLEQRVQLMPAIIQALTHFQQGSQHHELAGLQQEANWQRGLQAFWAGEGVAVSRARHTHALRMEHLRSRTTSLADSLFFGLCSMLLICLLCGLRYGILEHQLGACPLLSDVPTTTWWQPWAWLGAFRVVGCWVSAVRDALLGAGVMLAVPCFLGRTSLLHNPHAAPLRTLAVALGGVCGIAGCFAVARLGGRPIIWLVGWEAWLAAHMAAAYYQPPAPGMERQAWGAWLRASALYAMLTIVCPLLAGAAPFAPQMSLVIVLKDIQALSAWLMA